MRIRQRIADRISGGEFTRLGASIGYLATQLKESNREVERFKEDLGWTRRSEGQKEENRKTVRDYCRYAFQRGDPFIKGATHLLTEFAFEQGIDGPVSDNPATQKAINKFWNAPDNQSALFSTVSQLRASNQLLVDGDYFTILREGMEGDKRTGVRFMPAAQVVDIITDPFDLTRVLYFRCAVPDLKWNDASYTWQPEADAKTVFYKDVFNSDPANDPLSDKLGGRAEAGAYLLHTSINAIDHASFGWPEPAVSIPWFDRHKRIAQDQEAISRMTSALMAQLKVSATASEIDALASTITGRGQYDNGEANENLTGQMNILNDQIDMAINRASSRAGEAEVNARMMHMAGVVGLGIPLHFSGDPDNAGLATASTMDRPALVHMRAYQSVWLDAYRKMIDHALARMGIVDAQYDIPAPRIARQDISEAGKLIMEGYDANLLTGNQAATALYDLLGFDNIANELAAREKEMAEEEEQETTPLEEEVIEESDW